MAIQSSAVRVVVIPVGGELGGSVLVLGGRGRPRVKTSKRGWPSARTALVILMTYRAVAKAGGPSWAPPTVRATTRNCTSPRSRERRFREAGIGRGARRGRAGRPRRSGRRADPWHARRRYPWSAPAHASKASSPRSCARGDWGRGHSGSAAAGPHGPTLCLSAAIHNVEQRLGGLVGAPPLHADVCGAEDGHGSDVLRHRRAM